MIEDTELPESAQKAGSAPRTLLYLPGIDGTGRLLFSQPTLQTQFHIVPVSYPQDRHHDYRDLVDLAVKALASYASAVVVAESFGGAVGLMLALTHPARVEELVLVNTFAWYPRRLWIDGASWVGGSLPGWPASRVGQPIRSYFLFDPEVPLPIRQEWWRRTADVPLSALAHRVDLIRRLDLRSQLADVRVPTRILAAPNDRMVPCTAGRTLARRIPASQLWQPRVGHAALVHPRIDLLSWLMNS